MKNDNSDLLVVLKKRAEIKEASQNISTLLSTREGTS